MRKVVILGMLLPLYGRAQEEKLPRVFLGEQPDLPGINLRAQAAEAFTVLQPPTDSSWQDYSKEIKRKIIKNAGVVMNHDLPLQLLETGSQQLDGYTVRNIRFQTREGVYATASLYVPDGTGKFPAVITTHGHWDGGRRSEVFQAVGHSLAKNGYVCLIMDAWGAGERTTHHEVHEYHGANLGASLMNIGESVLGMQITDNIRGVDLLSSLPYVDANNIGATGASGGGNQVMWLAAIDRRIKAVVPVVSVGTFQSYILNSNCVCELLPNGLTFTEEAAVLGLIAPRALKIISAFKDANQAFNPVQMFRSYQPLEAIYRSQGAKDRLSYQVFDTGHGYWPEMREAMIGWFDFQLKGEGLGLPKAETSFGFLSLESLATYPKGEREAEVLTTADFNQRRGNELHLALLENKDINKEKKREELSAIVGLNGTDKIETVTDVGITNNWRRIIVKSKDGRIVPIVLQSPKNGKEYAVLVHSGGKDSIPFQQIDSVRRSGKGILIADLWGTGESASAEATKIDGILPPFHTLSRSAIWLGKTVMGEWVQDINLLRELLITSFNASQIAIHGYKEAGIAAVLHNAIYGADLKGDVVKEVVIFDSPYSYLFDTREEIDFYNMSIHIPNFLKWGDVSLANALASAQITFINGRSMSGILPDEAKLKNVMSDFDLLEKRVGKKQRVMFKEW